MIPTLFSDEPVLFMMAGVLRAHGSCIAAAHARSLRIGSTRILVPMVARRLVSYSERLRIVVMHWGIVGRRTYTGGVPLLHFWFLYYLSIFYVLALTLREAFDGLIDRDGRTRVAINSVVRSMTSTYIAPIVLAAPLFVVLVLFNDAWAVWWGIPAPSTSFMGLTCPRWSVTARHSGLVGFCIAKRSCLGPLAGGVARSPLDRYSPHSPVCLSDRRC